MSRKKIMWNINICTISGFMVNSSVYADNLIIKTV